MNNNSDAKVISFKMNKKIIDFYNGAGTDNCGRTLSQILKFSDEELESVHDWVQWIFPTKRPSKFNPDAPLLDTDTIIEFKLNNNIKNNVRAALAKMLCFYFNDNDAYPPWMTSGNHNYLRLTRILTSLSLLGFEAEAKDLLIRLNRACGKNPLVGKDTIAMWNATVKKARGTTPVYGPDLEMLFENEIKEGKSSIDRAPIDYSNWSKLTIFLAEESSIFYFFFTGGKL